MDARAEPPAGRRVRVDLADLAAAFDEGSWDVGTFLELDTGDEIRITAEVRDELEAIYAQLSDEQVNDACHRAASMAAIERSNPPGWMQELLLDADAVEVGLGTRYLRVPATDSRDGYGDMQAFIETISSPWLQERLWAAIRGRGAFRRFKDVLASAPAERERWFLFKDDRLRQRVLAWLAGEVIEPLPEAD